MAVRGLFGGLGRLASEPGEQPLESQPGRNWFRVVAVLGCESFGVRTEPGCLAKLVANAAGRTRGRAGARPSLPSRQPVRRPGERLPKVPLPAPPALPKPTRPAGVSDVVDTARGLLDFLLRP
jgi:hypothetical protein